MFYQIVRLNNGNEVLDLTPDNLFPALEIRGHEYKGACENKRLRPELQGQPQFTGLMGPMWGGLRDGKPVIRYEDYKAYDHLST